MLSIVVPTYCEADNLPSLLAAVDTVMRAGNISWEMIVADDDSPDQTEQVITALANDYPVRMIRPVGRERDLSLSVIDGIRAASHDTVLVMDADLSHPAETIPSMLGVLAQQPDAFVLGSRYVDEGGFDRHWSLWRFINSYVATLITRPLVNCLDPMSGFFAFSKRSLPDLASLRPIGYKIGLELMVRGQFSGCVEVPIQFQDREIGESKMNFAQQIKFLRHLRRLYTFRFGGLGEFASYGLVGASGFIVDLLFYYCLQFFGLSHSIARAVSFWPAVTWNWLFNRVATFGERERRPGARQWLEFVFTSLIGFSINWGVYMSLTTYTVFFNDYRLLALITGIAVASGFNFVASTLFIYNEKRH